MPLAGTASPPILDICSALPHHQSSLATRPRGARMSNRPIIDPNDDPDDDFNLGSTRFGNDAPWNNDFDDSS